jgi:hypothetical protein
MTISDTLDQLLRAALTPSAEARPPGAETESRDDPRVADVGALAAEVALKRAHELNGPNSEKSPGTDLARVEKLETSAGAAESLGLGFHLGAAMERIALAAREGSEGGTRLREAAWLIKRYITLLESRPIGADIHASTNRLVQTGGTIGADVEEIAAELATQPEPEEAFSLAPDSPPLRPPAEATEAAAPEPQRWPERWPERQPEPEPARQPTQIVHELPTVRRELFVTAARAAIAVAAITAVVLVLTLIAQWR